MNKTIRYRLLNQYNQIDYLIENLDTIFIEKRQFQDKWSIKENLAHLGRYQEIFNERFRTILNEKEHPSFVRYRADKDKVFDKWNSLDVQEIISKTKKDRKSIVEIINFLSEEQEKKKGRHPKLGLMNLSEWTEFFLLHETHHFYIIFWLSKTFNNN